jgi:hypothetical protein
METGLDRAHHDGNFNSIVFPTKETRKDRPKKRQRVEAPLKGEGSVFLAIRKIPRTWNPVELTYFSSVVKKPENQTIPLLNEGEGYGIFNGISLQRPKKYLSKLDDKEIIVDESQITFVIDHIDFAKFYAEVDLNSDQGKLVQEFMPKIVRFYQKTIGNGCMQMLQVVCSISAFHFLSFVYSFKEEFGVDESHGPDPDGYELHNEYELFRYRS